MDSNQKSKYTRSRYIVKKWENDFKKIKGIAPSKSDIKTAPKRVKDAYSTYWKLKSLLSESSLIDATFDENAKDCFSPNVSELSESSAFEPPGANDSILESSCNTSLFKPTEDSNIPSSDEIRNRGSSESSLLQSSIDDSFQMLKSDTSVGNPGLLGRSIDGKTQSETKDASKPANLTEPDSLKFLNGEKKVDKREVGKTSFKNSVGWDARLSINANKNVRTLKERSVSFQYSEKLFAGAKFSKRNPRKPGSFKRNKTLDSLPGISSTVENSLCAEPITREVLLKSCGQVSVASNEVVTEPERNECPLLNSEVSGADGMADRGHFNLLSEVKRVVIKEAPRVEYQGVNMIQALLRNNSENNIQVTRKIDSGWLGRLDSDSGIASNSGPADDSSDELIIDSDEESKSRFILTSSCSGFRRSESSNLEQVLSTNVIPNETKYSATVHSNSAMDCNKSLLLNTIEPSPTATCMNSALFSKTFSEPSNTEIASIKPSELSTNLSKPFPISTSLTNTSPSTETLQNNMNKSTSVGTKRSPTESILSAAKKPKLDNTSAAVQANKARNSKKQAVLEKKVASGVANKNFIRIDIQKKVYTRGRKGMNFSKYKKKQWKELKGLDSSGIIKCFKCGDVGHMARQCKAVGELMPYEEVEDEDIFPSLEDAEAAAEKQAQGLNIKRTAALQTVNLPLPNSEDSVDSVQPLYSLNPDGTLPDTPQEVLDALQSLGHPSFLPGQEEAIMNILCGKSCLVVMPTGSGKSLCYRLPALLFYKNRGNSLTLVVSPLVSLMEDQVLMSGSDDVGCLHHCQTEKQRKVTEERLAAKELSVLLVSPELLSSDSAISLASRLPPIAFVCIDEAHCLSHWSHNFRPSYLTLPQVLRQRLKVDILLGLTASVTASTADNVLSAMGGLNKVSLVKAQKFVPENLILSVSRDIDRDNALLSLLGSSRFSSCSSIIVYCTRREECVRVSSLLRTHLQDNSRENARKKRISADAEVYHAGLTASRRKQVQNAFMQGKIRIVVATVAFGMGLNKKDLRGVIHFNMPGSLENYLQEVGRAGRDGLPAHCHLFLSPASGDLFELKRHIYSSSVDRGTLRRLLELTGTKCTGCSRGRHEVAAGVDKVVDELDLAPEVISTLLSYLDSSGLGYRILPQAYTRARVGCYKGATRLGKLAQECGVLGVAIAQARAAGSKVSSSFEFDIIKLADSVGWDSGQVKNTLKRLEWSKTDNEGWTKSGLNVEFDTLGFRLIVPCCLSEEGKDTALDLLHQRAVAHEETALKQLNFLHSSLQAASYASVSDCADDIDVRRCDKLADSVHQYFTSTTVLNDIDIKIKEIECESDVLSSIRSLVGSGSTDQWTGRAIARIFHGISSPKYPALVWAHTPYWRRHLDQDFPSLLKLASHHLRYIR